MYFYNPEIPTFNLEAMKMPETVINLNLMVHIHLKPFSDYSINS